MSKERQLATRGSNGHMDLAQYARTVAQAQAQVTEKLIRETVLAVLDRPVALIKGSENPTKENVSFAKIGRGVIKISIQFRNYDLTYNPARQEFAGALPQPVISIEAASEGDLLDLERSLTKNGTGADLVAVRELLRIVRYEPAQPLEIRVVNASEVGAGVRVLTVKRDDDGKMSGMVVASP